MNFAIVLQLIGAVTIACGSVGIFDRLDNPRKAQKKNRATAANSHAVGSYHQR